MDAKFKFSASYCGLSSAHADYFILMGATMFTFGHFVASSDIVASSEHLWNNLEAE